MKKIAFITPWYGENIQGGAESECRSIIYNLQKKNISLEVLTTCVESFNSDWSINFHKEGFYNENGVDIQRFKVRKRNTDKFDQINYKLINNICINIDEEKVFFEEMVYSQSLFDYMENNKDEYHCFVFIPYMFGTTYWGIKKVLDKSILIPCLHDENYAYMKLMKNMFENVSGIIFNSQPEYELANKIYKIKNKTKQITIGTIIDTEFKYEPKCFIEKYKMKNPFILYAGRKDVGKNVDTLISYFENFRKTNDIKIDLVLIGGGKININRKSKRFIHDLGFVSKQDKYNAYSASLCLCQPSLMESFSIVIMESWIAKRPVLVSADCEVTKNFVKKSNGGLYFNTYEEFEECIKFFIKNITISNIMGQKGNEFVKNNFTYDIVTEKYINFFEQF